MPVSFGGQSQQRWGDNTLNAQEYMRDLLLADTEGTPCSTAQARKAGMLLLAFFNTTNATCQRVLPVLQKLHDAFADSGKLTVWAVSQNDADATRAFAEGYALRFPLLLDRDLWHSMLYGVTTVPTLYLTDSSGLVLHKIVGWRPNEMNAAGEQIAAFLEREPVRLAD